ncbi:type IX secretion system membrane protein PorP/SprF [Saprospiraceae bacterium]|jgi:type IX secretion system PorP/SprF family membrane protein|nr:type IX secretion system membrane protein PorP/SprF [Bacteroidota bacterium]MDB4727222.1 type IX secretion system membrane protein PorP/SprF [Saprospiraceae bacterium]MDF1865038.1 type IX secretion system membrane protein PorP/SprF [Saprospiraceae bacterium]
MKKSGLFFLFLLFTWGLQAQYARHSIGKYQFNALSINPAFAGSQDFGSFEMTYLGNFVGEFSLFRSIQVNLQAPFWSSDHSHWGTTFNFEKAGANIELGLRPAYSYSVDLDIGRISFGGVLGFSLFDFDENLLTTPVTEFRNFLSINGGLGVYLSSENYFAGVSTIQMFEKDFLEESRVLGQNFNRENPYYFIGGFKTRISERFELKPSILLKYSNIYLLPETGGEVDPDEFAADLNLTLIIEDNYYVSGFFGLSSYADDTKLTRYGLAVHLLMNNFRLSYGIQRMSRTGTNLDLPQSHLFSLGYYFLDE